MKVIIFDFDGVIADTYDFIKNICDEIGVGVSHEEFKAHHDGNVYETPAIKFTEQDAKNLVSKYFNQIHTTKFFLTKENLKQLSETYSLNIISSSEANSINKFLKHNEIEFFDEVLGVNFHKSKVHKFNYLFEKYNLKPNECIFISDTVGDILEGHKVDVKTIAVDYGFHDKERLKKANPHKIVSNFDEILKEINLLN
ncbi:MAG: HAD family hydrolase [Nanoarchaeales archaeon]|nr:HAD family hydrolase [Nanoarchaeales archaeon]